MEIFSLQEDMCHTRVDGFISLVSHPSTSQKPPSSPFTSMASQTPDSSFIALRHHDEYHLSGGDLYFLVEQYHFRVHRYFFERESTFFKHQLATPASPGEERQGTSEGTAIVLEHVTPAEFARFLWVFYNPKYSLYDATVEDWIIILKLADRWCFPEVKNLAVREVEKKNMDDIERIVVYQNYNVDKHLLVPRYAALCARTETLSLAEGIRLGMETALNIARARECARSPSVAGLRSPTSVALPDEEMHGIIADLFSISEASGSASKGQENGSSTASSSTTGDAAAKNTSDGDSKTNGKTTHGGRNSPSTGRRGGRKTG
ncbi:hypothetical protein F5146DRAFT_1027410 [Armillaria mellea]|nr:hypothetical protein F5146DRAFT_1027410 [Armillaria mellea]